ncbi:cation:proton antiporter [Archangium violaceum]|uniref:monovalent cation/H+ antiporter complex subunit F n=1 Tax=Archangium violaceum TaxID=83451 RepID=UPI002B2EB274|nr:cation:proton antiporter [Archangium violaceum]
MSGWFEVLLRGVLAVLALSVLLSLYRLLRGPSLPDRAVALDLIALQLTGAIAVYAVLTHEPVLLDAALVLAIISSLGTIAIARYLFSGKEGEP